MKKVIAFIVLIGFVSLGAKKAPYYVWVESTAYCPCSICCGSNANGLTAKMRDAYLPGVAVDPKFISLGSHLDIPGYKRGPNKNGSWIRADDTGRVIKKDKIDVRFKTHEEAKKWGRKWIRVRVHLKN